MLLISWSVSAPISYLLVSERSVISRLPATNTTADRVAAMSLDVALPLSSLHNVRALGYDVVDDLVYWVDGRSKSIRRARADGSRVCPPLQFVISTLVH